MRNPASRPRMKGDTMKVEVRILLEKIARFPDGYTEGVTHSIRSGVVTGFVQSWNRKLLADGEKTVVYDISLRPHEDGQDYLEGTCTCPSAKPCKHMAQLYAIVKEITPEQAEAIVLIRPVATQVGASMTESTALVQSLDWRKLAHAKFDELLDYVIATFKDQP